VDGVREPGTSLGGQHGPRVGMADRVFLSSTLSAPAARDDSPASTKAVVARTSLDYRPPLDVVTDAPGWYLWRPPFALSDLARTEPASPLRLQA
jgi:hypothetical protein